MRAILIIGLLIACFGCNLDDRKVLPPCEHQSHFQSYADSLGYPIIRDSLIACAASGQDGILDDNADSPTSILFYPDGTVSDIRYWSRQIINQFDNCVEDTSRIFNYTISPLFNGYLQKFQSDLSAHLGFVSYLKDEKIYISNDIFIKTASQPTAFNPSPIAITDTITGKRFEWSAAPTGEDVIYFQVVADMDGNLISGTYTTDLDWTFYDLSNVVLNIRDIDPPPTLTEDETYQFVLMGVSEDNWVNALWDTTFVY